ncbi:MAG: GerMN domain-containing protein [Armatimonadota bacterium]|nr:GerMN domain-containing protein [Armatimonadota bacterium]
MKRKSFAVLAILVFLVAVALGVYLGGRQKTPPAPMPPVPKTQAKQQKTVKVFHVKIEDSRPKLRPVYKQISADENPIEAALKLLVEQGNSKDPSNPIPEGTKLLGVEVKDGLAIVNFSHEFRDNFEGGSTGEALLIGAILRTLGQFPEIRQVSILVEGKPIDSLGHLDLSGRLDVKSSGMGFNNEIEK